MDHLLNNCHLPLRSITHSDERTTRWKNVLLTFCQRRTAKYGGKFILWL